MLDKFAFKCNLACDQFLHDFPFFFVAFFFLLMARAFGLRACDRPRVCVSVLCLFDKERKYCAFIVQLIFLSPRRCRATATSLNAMARAIDVTTAGERGKVRKPLLPSYIRNLLCIMHSGCIRACVQYIYIYICSFITLWPMARHNHKGISCHAATPQTTSVFAIIPIADCH